MWNPWRVLRDRRDTLFELTELPDEAGGAVAFGDRQGSVVLIDRRLLRTERKVTLAHELVHLERSGVESDPDQSPMWDAVVAREENTVDRIVADRLVPAADLDDWLIAREEPTTALDVAEAFDVTEDVALRALMAAAHRGVA